MIRFILHSILILVVTQLSNVAMGLIMTESQHTAVTYQLAQLHDSINKGQSLDFSESISQPVNPDFTCQHDKIRATLPGSGDAGRGLQTGK